MKDETYIRTAKIIYENKGDCLDIECEDCPFDNICNIDIKDEDRFNFAKEFLEEEELKLPIIKSEMIEVNIDEVRISYSKSKNIKIIKENNSIIIKEVEEQ